MKKLKNLLCLLTAAVMLLSFAACAKKNSQEPQATVSPAADAETPEPPTDIIETSPDEGLEPDSNVMIKDVNEVLDRPHTLQPGTVATFHTYDVPFFTPWNVTPWNATYEKWLTCNIYEGLVYLYMGRADDVRPLIAQSWSASEDRLTWTFKIRDGVKFTDGTLCDAEAVSAAWDYYYEASSAKFISNNIQSWKASEGNTFTVQLSAPSPYVEVIFSEIYILSPTALAQYGLQDNRAAVSTAPYYVKEHIYSEAGPYEYPEIIEYIFAANPDYYLYERAPMIETIKYIIIWGEDDKLNSFLTGQCDGHMTSSVDSYNKIMESDLDLTLLHGYGNPNPIFLNAGNVPEFQIYEVRKAINRLLDLEAINNALYGGTGLVQTSIWAEGSSGAVPWPEGFYYDQSEALELFAQAGIVATEFEFRTNLYAHQLPLFEIISSQLAEVGITMELQPYEIETGSPWLMRCDWGIFTGSNGYSNTLPYMPWTLILLPNHPIKSIWTDIYDPELYGAMCKEYDAMLSAASWSEMLTGCKAITDMVQMDYAAMPGVQAPFFAAFNNDLKGVVVINPANPVLLWNYLYY